MRIRWIIWKERFVEKIQQKHGLGTMRRKPKEVEPIPSRFETYDAAGKFWDTHDTTDYPSDFKDASVVIDLKGRRFEIEIDEDVADMLRKKARRARTGAAELASRLLRKQLAAT